ncbi:MAG: serine hydrolase domain-containing protein [Myxococcota bacterium]
MWADLEALLQAGVKDGLFPGCAIAVRSATDEIFSVAVGQAEQTPQPRPATLKTPWDLASITKVLGATPVAMRLMADGRLDLDAPIRERIPDAPEGVTAAHCLSHTSGLPAWRALFEDFPDPDRWGTDDLRQQALRRAYTTPVFAPPGVAYVYSDLGMMLLCALLEHIGGERIDAVWQREARAAELRWGWPVAAAATEDCPARGRVLVGEVHDLNTAVLGGASTHAGLFGPVEAVAAAAAWQLRAWMGEAGEGLSPAVVRRFWSHRAVGSHHLGWDGVTPGKSTAGDRWPLTGVGHTGFTGGVLWIAPEKDVVVAFCSNRVHPHVEGGARPGATGPKTAAFRALRPKVFTAVVEALEADGRW